MSSTGGRMGGQGNIAVLIDGENVSDKYIKFIFEELSNNKEQVTYKRIYGDWTDNRLGAWKKVLHDYSITPIQQYAYTSGKNSSDSALIIDAMDILYSGSVSAFCIVSSDSDFTRLASRLRESGMLVIGMGERKTPKPFIAACESFKYLEVISGAKKEDEPAEGDDLAQLIPVLEKIVEENCDEGGFIFLGTVGSLLSRKLPDFDVRNYGFRSLTQLIRATKSFKVDVRQLNGGSSNTYIALKR
uniref:Maebl n=1 Tax=uncultured bacterium contig00006 TaxID=1181498 RepID=A0A806JYJ8_9BACT|nr:Maebl [uncultured bacterium contig00006]